jgi:NADH:ubiquinone oxidoreductase subunit 5 (subunit L)/multisubunit Na+/H+ antiporter MnhA subunit
MSIFTSFLLAIFIFFEVVLSSSSCLVTICPWFQTELLVVSWGFLFDTLSSIMFLVVLSVSSLVHIYSTEYLASDPHQGRFMGYLSLFTGFMLVLVSADNFVVMFFG